MPTPKKNETKKEFMDRCPAFLEKEPQHKDKSYDQRYAICLSLWQKYKQRKVKDGRD